jgi:hypothetical protein
MGDTSRPARRENNLERNGQIDIIGWLFVAFVVVVVATAVVALSR